MKFKEFIKIYRDSPIIDSSTFSFYENADNLRRQVRDWIKKEYLLTLKRGIYVFSEEYRKVEPSVNFIANFLILPSYISMEYALSYYNLIPEKATVITSVTTKKTNMFENFLGRFEYRSVKDEMFCGFKKEVEKEQEYFIALPEKALVDYFYLNNQFKGRFSEFESIRLQNLDILNKKVLSNYRKKSNARVRNIIDLLIKYTEYYKREYEKL